MKNTVSIINPFDITNYERTVEEKQMFIIFAMAVAGKEAKQISFKVMDLIYNPTLKNDNKNLSLYEKIKNLKEDPYKYLKEETIGFNNKTILDKEGKLLTPFEILKKFNDTGTLEEELKRVKLGKYALLLKGYALLGDGEIELDGKEALNPDYYEKIPGISFKSSRFFILHSYKDTNIAVLDTHILKFLRNIGVKECKNIKQTPSSKKLYLEIEKRFLDIFWELKRGKLEKNIKKEVLDRLSAHLPESLEETTISDFDFAIWKHSKQGKED